MGLARELNESGVHFRDHTVTAGPSELVQVPLRRIDLAGK